MKMLILPGNFRRWITPLCCLLLVSFGLKADNVTINVTGDIMASPCVVVGGNNVNVDLGQEILTSAINSKVYSDSGWKNFTVKLKNCPSSKEFVIATFHGTPGSGVTTYASTGDAKNVEVLLQTGDTHAPMGNGMEHWVTIQSDRTASFPLEARAVSPNRNATPGSIAAVVTMSFTYN